MARLCWPDRIAMTSSRRKRQRNKPASHQLRPSRASRGEHPARRMRHEDRSRQTWRGFAGSRDAATAVQVVIRANRVVRMIGRRMIGRRMIARPMIARRMIARVAAAALLLGFAPRLAAQDSEVAADVKATYVSRFASFVQWPGPAAEFPGDVFPVCVADDASGFVTRAAKCGQRAGGRWPQRRGARLCRREPPIQPAPRFTWRVRRAPFSL